MILSSLKFLTYRAHDMTVNNYSIRPSMSVVKKIRILVFTLKNLPFYHIRYVQFVGKDEAWLSYYESIYQNIAYSKNREFKSW